METEQSKARTNKKRVRPRTKAVRIELKNRIETTLLLKRSPILHLFKPLCETDLAASLDEVLTVLGYDENSKVRKLSRRQLCSISNKSRVFNIVGVDKEPLQIVFDSRNRDNLEDKTVYVDNLPLSCSADQLRRRAGVFGTVVHVHMPNVSRLRRRHCSGVESPLNSGFAFIQFSSKTAVRRFCRRYAANCHLNRTHHPKTHRKRKNQLNAPANAGSVMPNPTPTVESDTFKSNLDDSSLSQNRSFSAMQPERRVRRSTEVSISGLDSGTESDFTRPLAVAQSAAGAAGAEVKPKLKLRRRKHKMPVTAFSLTKYLSKLQVFTYPKYKELRREYIQLKSQNLKALKSDMIERDLIHSEADIENIDFSSRGDNQMPQSRRRKRQQSRRQTDGDGSSEQQPKRRKRRSRANVMRIATRLKDESFAIPYSNQIYNM